MSARKARTIVDLMRDLFGAFFAGASWQAWQAYLAAVFALPMSENQAATFRACTGRQALPAAVAREVWTVVGRRGGKSRVAALLAVFLAAFKRYTLAPGERGVVMVIASDRRQARVAFRYITALLEGVPMLARLIERRTAEAVHLTTFIDIEVHTASFKAVRGYTVVAAILDEIAFWPVDDAANPDSEIVNALRPAMATMPNALLVAISSPYARRGELWKAHRDHFGKDDDPVLVWQADTRTMNPTVPQSVIDEAQRKDPAVAAAEYGAQFRSDLEAFVSPEAVADCVVPGRIEIPPRDGTRYAAFFDGAGGGSASGDSNALVIGHRAMRGQQSIAIVDAIREVRPPCSPDSVIEDFAKLLHSYHVTRITGDRFAGEWPREAFRRRGIVYELAERSKREIYADALALLNSGRLELPDHPRLIGQLLGLERRTTWGGHDAIDHAPGAHDDLANVVCGVATELTLGRCRPDSVLWGRDARRPRYEQAGSGPAVPWWLRDITEGEILEALAPGGDDLVDRYRRGELPREEAVQIAGRRRRELPSLGRALFSEERMVFRVK